MGDIGLGEQFTTAESAIVGMPSDEILKRTTAHAEPLRHFFQGKELWHRVDEHCIEVRCARVLIDESGRHGRTPAREFSEIMAQIAGVDDHTGGMRFDDELVTCVVPTKSTDRCISLDALDDCQFLLVKSDHLWRDTLDALEIVGPNVMSLLGEDICDIRSYSE